MLLVTTACASPVERTGAPAAPEDPAAGLRVGWTAAACDADRNDADADGIDDACELERFRWADGARRGAPVVWVASGKHGGYPSRASCDSGHWFYDSCGRNTVRVRFPVRGARQNIGSRARPFVGLTGFPCVLAESFGWGSDIPDPAARECLWSEAGEFRGWRPTTASPGPLPTNGTCVSGPASDHGAAAPTPRPPWWETYFDEAFLRIYEDFLTPERTRGEVAGILALLQLAPGVRVLDLACGRGRHSVALAEAGMDVTKVDLSETLLERAQRDAAEAGVEVEWVRAEMREIGWNGEFHGVLSLFSSLGLFGTDEEDLRVLRAAHRALRPGGMLLLEVMHRDQVVAEYAERDRWETEDGTVVRVQREWDAVAGISHERLRWRRGRERGEKPHRIRVRSDTEWEAMLRAGGFAPLTWSGSWEGERFGRGSRADDRAGAGGKLARLSAARSTGRAIAMITHARESRSDVRAAPCADALPRG